MLARHARLSALAVAAALGTFAALSPLPQAADQAAADLQSAVDAIGAEAIASKAAPGLSIAIGRKGRLEFAGAYGMANLELRVPVRSTSVFRIGSVTKQFTAAPPAQSHLWRQELHEPRVEVLGHQPAGSRSRRAARSVQERAG
jgi:CubicO group peptidase (beta-lactamase class C family)